MHTMLAELFAALCAAMLFHFLLFAFGFKTITSMAQDRRRSNPVFAVVGFMIAGGLLGYASTAVLSHSVSPGAAFRAFNLVFTPSVCGIVMHRFGESLRQKRVETTYLTSFRGAAALAFGIVLARFLLVPSPP